MNTDNPLHLLRCWVSSAFYLQLKQMRQDPTEERFSKQIEARRTHEFGNHQLSRGNMQLLRDIRNHFLFRFHTIWVTKCVESITKWSDPRYCSSEERKKGTIATRWASWFHPLHTFEKVPWGGIDRKSPKERTGNSTRRKCPTNKDRY